MTSPPLLPALPMHASSVEICLAQIEDLRLELQQAMGSLASTVVYDFEQSLWRQKVLCTSLGHVMQNLQAEQLDTATVTRLQTAMKALQAANKTYEAVIRQASTSNQILHSVCCTFTGTATDAAVAVGRTRFSLEA